MRRRGEEGPRTRWPLPFLLRGNILEIHRKQCLSAHSITRCPPRKGQASSSNTNHSSTIQRSTTQQHAPPAQPELPSPRQLHPPLSSPSHLFSRLQGLAWAAEVVVGHGVSVLWADMDVAFFSDPFEFMFGAAPDADAVFSSDHCEPGGCRGCGWG